MAEQGTRAQDSGVRTQLALWARDWALGPSGGQGVPPYVSHVANGTGQEEAGNGSDNKET